MQSSLFWVNPFPAVEHLTTTAQRRVQLVKLLDNRGFNIQVWAVAASGFFTDSYNLFATNVILPALAFVYWPNATDTNHETIINITTLIGTIIGQLSFGYLADRFGRQRLYGFELLLVLISTLGLAQSSYGVPYQNGINSSMSIFGWILFWRFIMGIGIGAEYPLSAVITSEWSSTKSRPRLLASVFIMQPLGQFAAYLVGVIALYGLKSHYGIDKFSDPNTAKPIIDQFWRLVAGLGAIPAIVALAFRFSIPESGRWRLDVCKDSQRALSDTRVHFQSVSTFSSDDLEMEMTLREPIDMNPQVNQPFSWQYLRDYFYTQGNWRYLAATSGCWALIDFVYYGVQLNNPRFMTKLWAENAPTEYVSHLPSWASDPGQWDPVTNMSKSSIYSILMTNAYHSMIAVSIGSIFGSLLLIIFIPYIPRRKFFISSFLLLAILTPAAGASFLETFRTSKYPITLSLFILCQTFFDLGPNSLIYIIPAEIFPTALRCTCHGFAAAAGKIASVIVQSTLQYMKFGNSSVKDINSSAMGWVLIIFSPLMLLGAVLAWAWLPELQGPSRVRNSKAFPNKSLETLALGKVEAERNGQIIGLRKRIFKAKSTIHINS